MSISNDEIYRVLLEMKGAQGEIAATLKGHLDTFKTHVQEDEAYHATTTTALNHIELKMASQRGAVKTWGVVATAAATIASAIIAFFSHHTL